jgi:pantothenate kinase
MTSELFKQIRQILNSDTRRAIIGIVGKPAAGKSTVVEQIASEFSPDLVCVIPMDGYHLSNETLIELGKRDTKGAPDTFDPVSLIALLKRVKNETEAEHPFPIFHREIEASVQDEGVVRKSARVIVIEGNYLFSREHGWDGLFELLDHTWFIEVDDQIRIPRLIARHIEFGKTPEEAEAWVRRSDDSNAKFIDSTAGRASNIIKF